MKPRAVICDIYKTVLRVDPPPADSDSRREELWIRFFGSPPASGRGEFEAACRREIETLHAESKRRGIAHPEIQWPRVLGKTVPGFDALGPGERMDFQVLQQGLGRRTSLAPGAAMCLRDWVGDGIPIGIASNAQAYTRRELEEALGSEGLGTGIFLPALSLWSWELGFSKPDPYFFQALAARLLALGLDPAECLMIGDRMDNDILPARAIGMRTWHLRADGDGDWFALREALNPRG